LLKRARTDTHSFDLRDAFVSFVVQQSVAPGRLWNLVDAKAAIDYLDKCWMYPDYIVRTTLLM